MPKKFIAAVISVCFCLSALAQAQQTTGEKGLLGSWNGTWSGGSNGTFVFKVTKGADGKLGGSITPKPEGGESYTCDFKSVVIADGKVTLKLNDPEGEADITLEATLEGTVLKGTYVVKIKADGNEVDRGTITASRQP